MDWLVGRKKIEDSTEVSSVAIIKPNVIRIERNRFASVVVVTFSLLD